MRTSRSPTTTTKRDNGLAGSPTYSWRMTARSIVVARTRSFARPSRSGDRVGTYQRHCRYLSTHGGRSWPPAQSSRARSASLGEWRRSSHRIWATWTPSRPTSAFRTDLELYLAMLGVEPELISHDLHPEYLSTKWALEQDAELVGVQHHHAHAAACLAEHGEVGPVLALIFDGTGYGADGTLWGGELLRCDLEWFERLAHLTPVPLPGGEAAIRQPWRTCASYLEAAKRPVPFERWAVVRESLKVNAPLSSGMGRLFDAVSALLGVREEVTYEGQAAIELEHLAEGVSAKPYAWSFGNGPALVGRVHDDLVEGRSRSEIAAAFHETIALAAARACAEAGGLDHGRALGRDLPEPATARRDASPPRTHGLPRALASERSAERRRDQLRPGCGRRGTDRVTSNGDPPDAWAVPARDRPFESSSNAR